MAVDLRLNAIIDPAVAGGHDIVSLARRVASGGATLIQLRDKRNEARAILAEARAIKAVLSPLNVPFVINDRVDVASAAAADGVHLGQDDLAPADARRILGAGAIIGLSIKSVAEAEAAPIDLIDYAGVGGVYVTRSKEQTDPPIGPAGVARVVAALRRRSPLLPICGIGGIDASNAAAVIAAGADGIAVISALSLVPDPGAAAGTLREIVDGMLAKRGA